MPYVHAVVPIKPPAKAHLAKDTRSPWDDEVDIDLRMRSGESLCIRPIVRHLKIDGDRGEEQREKG